MEMKQIIIKDFKEQIKNNIILDNAGIQKNIKFKMMKDTFENEIHNQNLDNYIQKIYNYYTFYFLGKNLSDSSFSLIKESEFNKHKSNFFLHCQEYEEQIIKKELPYFSNKFLDIQATTEKEKHFNVEIVNKRNYLDFMKTTEKFLLDNFHVYSFKIYIFFVITNIIDTNQF